MNARPTGTARAKRGMIGVLAVGVLVVASCSAPDEVVFEGTPTSHVAAAPTSPSGDAGDMVATTSSGPGPTSTMAAAGSPDTTQAVTTTPVTSPASTPSTLATSERNVEELPGQIVVNDLRSRSVTILGPRAEQFEPFANPGEDLHQPTWSPDGTLLAWSRATSEGFSVVVSSNTGGPATPYETPFGVFYMQWRPDSRAIALLGAPAPGQVGLAILDLDSRTVTALNSSTSYYFHWSPDGDELITHLGGTRLEQLDPSTGSISVLETLEPVNSVFQAAAWTPDGRSILYVRPAPPDIAGAPDELVAHDLGTGVINVLAEGNGFFNFAISPDGKTLAYSIRNLEGLTSMGIVDLAGGSVEQIDAPSTLAWQWSPDSRKILLFGAGEGAMTVSIYESGGITRYQDFFPTTTFVQNYLFFWSQYDLSHTLWAPDSSAFVFPAFDRSADFVFLQFLEDELPILIGPGSMAVFSPVGNGP